MSIFTYGMQKGIKRLADADVKKMSALQTSTQSRLSLPMRDTSRKAT
ncbi:MAG: hypothetical protein L6V93_02995 [Clostridiales bacterium]|nr:MAG: hypothetical protein L6V93_02995 [Clostridiales bacterium]